MIKISPADLTIIPLDKVPLDSVQGFSCGNPLIDAYLKTEFKALYDHKIGIASTNIVLFEDIVVGFFRASCTQVKVPEVDNSIGISTLYVPAIEVKFLAVSENYHRRGIGKIILSLIVSQAYEFSTIFACRYIFLWSVPEPGALNLYTSHFFIDTGTENNDGSHLMMFQLPEDIEVDEY